jgi:thioredoxin reductase (NADPH)
VHGFPAGLSGVELLSRLREQATRYGTAIRPGTVQTLVQQEGGFVTTVGGDRFTSATIVLATGVIDRSPDMPGLREATLSGCVRWCPICDGYEVTDLDVAVLASAGEALAHALFLRTYTRRLTLFALPGGQALDAAERRAMDQAGIRLITEPIEQLHMDGARRAIVQLVDGRELGFDTLYPMLGCTGRTELARHLGAAHDDEGMLQVDAHQCTSVQGLYAVGDAVNALNQLCLAAAHAATAATAIHNALPDNWR